MQLKVVLLLVLVLCQLGQRFLSQLTTAGYMYELIAGQDNDDAASAAAKFTAYFDCWQDDSCFYVAEEKNSGAFVLKKAGATLNNDKYSAVWKKSTIDIDECLSNPCRNGTCTDRVSGYHCICNPGFNGTQCDIEIDECSSNPCVNGQCSDKLNDYQCTCNRGYYGKQCNKNIDDCVGSPCGNGTCIDRVSGYHCTCNPGFNGTHCENEIDECSSNPCVNGTCSDRVNDYHCTCNPGYHGKTCNKKIKSCIDIYISGTRTNGKFLIFGADDIELEVYCDFQSEANSTWTLVVSYSLMNKNLFHFPYYNSKPRNSASPNWNDYRLDKPNMQAIQSQNTLWRITCGFPKYGVDYRDYLRVKNSDLNFMGYDGQGLCYTVEHIDIRGHSCSLCKVAFYQGHDSNVHTDSSKHKCNFQASQGSVHDEDNFGLYLTFNPAFRCTENQDGTTQVWFGGQF